MLMMIWKDDFMIFCTHHQIFRCGDSSLDKEKSGEKKKKNLNVKHFSTTKYTQKVEHKSNLTEDAGLRHVANANNDAKMLQM